MSTSEPKKKVLEVYECEICGVESRKPHRHNHYSLDLATIKSQLWAIIVLLAIITIVAFVTCEHAGNVADAVR